MMIIAIAVVGRMVMWKAGDSRISEFPDQRAGGGAASMGALWQSLMGGAHLGEALDTVGPDSRRMPVVRERHISLQRDISDG